MSARLMNKLFNIGVKADKIWFKQQADRLLSSTGAQPTLYKDLLAQE